MAGDREGINCKATQGNSWGWNGNVLHLECGGGYVNIYIYQNSPNYTSKKS